jgi:hypothetical protein
MLGPLRITVGGKRLILDYWSTENRKESLKSLNLDIYYIATKVEKTKKLFQFDG